MAQGTRQGKAAGGDSEVGLMRQSSSRVAHQQSIAIPNQTYPGGRGRPARSLVSSLQALSALACTRSGSNGPTDDAPAVWCGVVGGGGGSIGMREMTEGQPIHTHNPPPCDASVRRRTIARLPLLFASASSSS